MKAYIADKDTSFCREEGALMIGVCMDIQASGGGVGEKFQMFWEAFEANIWAQMPQVQLEYHAGVAEYICISTTARCNAH